MTERLKHEFIETIPEDLDEGIIYISTRFRVAIHLCCCGCKNKVVTPLSPVRWKLVFDGKSVSLDPSIGNWNYDCESHYWIINSKVEWARKWTKNEIVEGKSFERRKRAHYYSTNNEIGSKDTTVKNSFIRKLLTRIINFINPN